MVLELGFDDVGIVRATALDAEGSHLAEWLERGYHGNMSWMAREPERRAEPRKIFPDARSVVVVILNYYSPDAHLDHADSGKISMY
jgi:epoxyqueuosine reductase